MPTLLSIPREVRDLILDEVLLSLEAQPPAEHINLSRRPLYFEAVGHRIRVPCVEFPTGQGLFRTCHRLHAEIIDRTRKLKPPYILDLYILNETFIFPTWLSCPPRLDLIELLKVNIRFSGPYCPAQAGGLTPLYNRPLPESCIPGLFSPIAESLTFLIRKFLGDGDADHVPVALSRSTSNQTLPEQDCLLPSIITPSTSVPPQLPDGGSSTCPPTRQTTPVSEQPSPRHNSTRLVKFQRSVKSLTINFTAPATAVPGETLHTPTAGLTFLHHRSVGMTDHNVLSSESAFYWMMTSLVMLPYLPPTNVYADINASFSRIRARIGDLRVCLYHNGRLVATRVAPMWYCAYR